MKKKGASVAKGKKVKKAAAKKKTPAKKSVVKKVSARAAKKPSPSVKKAAKKAPAVKAKAKTKKTTSTTSMKLASPKASKKSSVKWNEFVTPLDDRLMVQIIEGEKRTAGGLYIPDTASDVTGNKQGVAVAVGRGHRDAHGKIRPMDVQIGDKVVFAEYAGSKIDLLGETLILLRESEVMGILTS